MNLNPPSPLALYEALYLQGAESAIAMHLSCPFTGRRYLPDVMGANEAEYVEWAKQKGASPHGAHAQWQALLVQVQQTST